jgi:hypothetical protein
MTDHQVAENGRHPDCNQGIDLSNAFLFGILAFLFTPIAAVVLVIGSYVVWTSFVPKHSADFHFNELNTTITLRFYMIWDEDNDSGRYLTVKTPYGKVTQNMCGWDWAHRSRTNIYLTEDRKIEISGPDDCDYVVSTNPAKITPVISPSLDRWTYLGAFGFSAKGFRFIPASEEMQCRWPTTHLLLRPFTNPACR